MFEAIVPWIEGGVGDLGPDEAFQLHTPLSSEGERRDVQALPPRHE